MAAVDHHGGGFFCIDAVEEALAKYGRPEIFNTDRGSQFTSAAFTGLLLENEIAISMDGRGSWRDNAHYEINRQVIHLSKPKRCLDQADHLFRAGSVG